MLGYLGGKMCMCRVGLCHYKKPRRVLVYTVDYAGAKNAVYRGKPALQIIKQGINKGAVGVTRCGMHHHPLGLVHHKKMLVLVNHLNWNILRLCLYILRWRQ